MSWYDHATLLALRLGPWTDAGGRERSLTGREVEAAWIADRQAAPLATGCGERQATLRARLARLSLRRRDA
ncbi:hypothetical protein [Pararhodobacter aggregans]|uniref:Uncharacterized protein n=1 Tax=Pararhodobacter aggregans TaxID=404875 RepID=A0A2T7UVQ7_9RHOB|nr:hypothetical protein [Pararhodobacter aggregans]PTW99536.1 hypothetical protein C8N33_11441 [Pararhodobacter aggregans]PVE48865.1 hypothetical protein DDE23_00205 [Pararhodobacter aggregans]